MADTTTKKKKVDKDQETLSTVLQRFRAGYDYVDKSYKTKWENCWKVYNNMRVSYSYVGTSDTFVPETFTIVESLVANIAGGKPKFMFYPTNREQEEDTDALNEVMDYIWYESKMNLHAQVWVRDMITKGNGVLMAYWDPVKKLPKVRLVPLSDFFCDPTCVDMSEQLERGYVGYRYLTSIDALKRQKVFDTKTGELVPKYKNLDKVESVNDKNWDDLEKAEKEKYIGSTLGKEAHQNQVEVIYYIDRDKLCEVVNRKVVIYDDKNPFQRGPRKLAYEVVIDGEVVDAEKEVDAIGPILPFAVLRNYIDGSLFYAKGDVEIIMERQEDLNDLENQDTDNITFVLDNMWTIDPQYQDMLPEIQSSPGIVFPLPNGALRPVEKPQVTRDANVKKAQIKDEMRRATAADEVIQGVSQDKGRITATEIQAQLNQSSQRFSTKVNNLESEGFAQLGEIMFKMIQMFVDEPFWVSVLGREGFQEWKQFSPADFTGEYRVQVKLENSVKAMKLEEGQKLQAMYQLFLQDPEINQTEMKKLLLERTFDAQPAEIKKLLVPQQPGLPEQLEQLQPAPITAGVGATL